MIICGKNNCVKQGFQGPGKSWNWRKKIPSLRKFLNCYVVLENPGMDKIFTFITQLFVITGHVIPLM